jgi:hypothetical protein
LLLSTRGASRAPYAPLCPGVDAAETPLPAIEVPATASVRSTLQQHGAFVVCGYGSDNEKLIENFGALGLSFWRATLAASKICAPTTRQHGPTWVHDRGGRFPHGPAVCGSAPAAPRLLTAPSLRPTAEAPTSSLMRAARLCTCAPPACPCNCSACTISAVAARFSRS